MSDGSDALAPGPVGIVGLGVVGATIERAFREADVPTRGYDSYLGVGTPESLAPCEVVFLCVPTPGIPGTGYDLSAVWTAVGAIEPLLRPGTVIAVKATVPPGTSDVLASSFPRLRFASVPEFLVASSPWESFTRPDRVVIGAISRTTAEQVARLMNVVAPLAPVVTMTPSEAELVKLCSNAMLAAKVSMANELAEVCGRYNVSWSRVQGVVGLDRRIGPDHLTVTPERGFGGQCLPKDLEGLIAAAAAAGYAAPLLAAIAEFNRVIRREDPVEAQEAVPLVGATSPA